MLEIARKHEVKRGLNSHQAEMKALWGKVAEIEARRKGTLIKNVELPKPGRDVTIQLRQKLNEYLNEIEKYTGIIIPQNQKEIVNQYVNTHNVVRLDEEQKKVHRADFNRKRNYLRKEWEAMTGRAWPRYEKDLYINGKLARRAGAKFDAHHIVENSYGGPHEWWNLHPAAFPNQHQDGIHKNNSVASQIFGPIKPEYHVDPKEKNGCVMM